MKLSFYAGNILKLEFGMYLIKYLDTYNTYIPINISNGNINKDIIQYIEASDPPIYQIDTNNFDLANQSLCHKKILNAGDICYSESTTPKQWGIIIRNLNGLSFVPFLGTAIALDSCKDDWFYVIAAQKIILSSPNYMIGD